ncbi:hypothetical protein GmHk_07G019081 [Glycine max]|nr:hypothetical protein GmHk_07G019081 [Glycine max]
MEPTMEELINKTQLFPKIIPMSSHQLGGSSTESHFLHPTVVIWLPRTMFAIFTGINHTIQNCKGEFIIKRTKDKSK